MSHFLFFATWCHVCCFCSSETWDKLGLFNFIYLDTEARLLTTGAKFLWCRSDLALAAGARASGARKWLPQWSESPCPSHCKEEKWNIKHCHLHNLHLFVCFDIIASDSAYKKHRASEHILGVLFGTYPRWTCPYFGITPLRAANLPYCFQLLFLEDQLEHVSTPHQTSSSNSTLLSLTQAARIQDIQDAYPGRFVAYLMPGRSGCELRRFLVPSPFAKNIKTYQNAQDSLFAEFWFRLSRALEGYQGIVISCDSCGLSVGTCLWNKSGTQQN